MLEKKNKNKVKTIETNERRERKYVRQGNEKGEG